MPQTALGRIVLNRNAMGGARLSQGGLHFGHYLGCIAPLSGLTFDHAFFVIRDVDRDTDAPVSGLSDQTLEFARDLLAIETASRLQVVRQSFLLNRAPSLWRVLLSAVSVRHLINAHPVRRHLKADSLPNSSVANLLFPIDSVHSYYCTGASWVCMNDDNLRFVDLGARYARRLRAEGWDDIIPAPSLRTGPVPRLLGHDHAKVSHSRRNAFYLRDGSRDVRRYIYRLFNKSSFFKRWPEEHGKYADNPKDYVFPASFAPYAHMSLLLPGHEVRALTLDDFDSSVERLTGAAIDFLDRFSAARRQLSDADVAAALADTEGLLTSRLEIIEARALGSL